MKHSAGLRHKELNVSRRECRQPNYPREEHSAHQVLAYDQEVDREEPEEQESERDKVEVTAMKSDSLPSLLALGVSGANLRGKRRWNEVEVREGSRRL